MSDWYEKQYEDKIGYIKGWSPTNKDSIPTWRV